jgi:hypothetical protein
MCGVDRLTGGKQLDTFVDTCHLRNPFPLFHDIYQVQASSIKPLKLLSKITRACSIPQQAWM